MQKHGMVSNTGRRRAILLGAATIALLLVTSMPRPVAAARSFCDAEWARYNDCLVSASGWVMQKLCDVEFLASFYACVQRELQ